MIGSLSHDKGRKFRQYCLPAGAVMLSEAGVLLEELPYCATSVTVKQSNSQTYAFTVFFQYPDKVLIFCHSGDLINPDMFPEDLCVPSDGQLSPSDGKSVDKGSHKQCQEDDCDHDEHHDKDQEDSSFRAVCKHLYTHTQECQSAQKAKYILLRLVSEYKLVHRKMVLFQC